MAFFAIAVVCVPTRAVPADNTGPPTFTFDVEVNVPDAENRASTIAQGQSVIAVGDWMNGHGAVIANTFTGIARPDAGLQLAMSWTVAGNSGRTVDELALTVANQVVSAVETAEVRMEANHNPAETPTVNSAEVLEVPLRITVVEVNNITAVFEENFGNPATNSLRSSEVLHSGISAVNFSSLNQPNRIAPTETAINQNQMVNLDTNVDGEAVTPYNYARAINPRNNSTTAAQTEIAAEVPMNGAALANNDPQAAAGANNDPQSAENSYVNLPSGLQARSG